MYHLCRVLLILAVLVSYYCLATLIFHWGGLVFIGLVIVLMAVVTRRRSAALIAFGTARWADANDLLATGMLDASRGLILGRAMDAGKLPLGKAQQDLFNLIVPSQAACKQFLASLQFGQQPKLNPALVRLPHAVHTAVFAPTGVGKGVSCVIPFLLTTDESAVVVDFKGENFRITAEHRRQVFGHRIVALDPFSAVTRDSDTFNPLEFIDGKSPLGLDEARSLAEALVLRTGQEHERHWLDSAEGWISALIALVVHYAEPNDRSLQTVRTLLTNPQKLEMAIRLMCASEAWGGMLARLGHQLTQFKDRELGSTLTTTNRMLCFLDTLAVFDITRSSSFNPDDLRSGKLTVYLILPPEHMRTHSPLVRVWIGSLLRAVVRGGLEQKNNVHFILDEAASLGHMEALDDAVDKFRAYSVRLQFYFQSLGQLKKSFPDGQDQTLLSNVTQVFFGINDLPTAEYVSNRLGESTIVLNSGGTGTGTSHQTSIKGDGSSSTSSNENDNWGQHGMKLLKPEQVLALSDRIAITFTPQVPPVWTTLARYYEEPLLPHEPGKWVRFQAMAKVVYISVSLLIVALMLAMVTSGKSHDGFPVEQPSTRDRLRIPSHRKTGAAWQAASSSRS
jgi:type IV secretion system protein VirD4